jgi:hypothetical protein
VETSVALAAGCRCSFLEEVGPFWAGLAEKVDERLGRMWARRADKFVVERK